MLRSTRKADEVAGDLLGRIVSGEIAVNSLLPKEAELAEAYGVGRSVVREAGKLLEVHRLVKPVKRRGTLVLDPLESLTPAVVQAMLVPAQGQVDVEVLAEFLEIRAELDVMMTRLAAERHSAGELADIQRCAARLEDPSADEDQALREFGLAMARAAHNRLFVMLSHWHRQITLDLAPRFRELSAVARRQRGYQLLLDAIERRDAELAAKLVRQFHDWANAQLIASLGEQTCSD